MDLTLKAPARLDDFAEFFGSASHSLDHLELHDRYAVSAEDELWRWWVENGKPDDLPPTPGPYWDLTKATAARGVVIRRARLVSTGPVSDYQRFLYAGRRWPLEQGEQARWLNRDLATDLRLPGNDFWLADAGLDSARVLFNLFDADGRPKGKQVTTDPDVVKFCAESFAAVWDRAVYPADEIFG
ncbi:hypothetical protein LO762_29880 [Actinocorallia sp. API 0066]|uniref:DUF6879 family protein n=1 Tax=Actinocorallia sp. API 0066 TaxID=2896846 RepID=UPI001E37EADF|nr:DUF6879 family protein [Actinocorallia sp. API 0066]MCD0453359.1 hypothetical protein [Actinocorallia sp. API 0066]